MYDGVVMWWVGAWGKGGKGGKVKRRGKGEKKGER